MEPRRGKKKKVDGEPPLNREGKGRVATEHGPTGSFIFGEKGGKYGASLGGGSIQLSVSGKGWRGGKF